MQQIPDVGVYSAGELPDYVEQFRVADLSLGTYSIPAGGVDTQSPHTEDELYIVTKGRARLRTPSAEMDAVPGVTLFVPAGEPHRFVDVTEDFAAIVVFGPAEGSRA